MSAMRMMMGTMMAAAVTAAPINLFKNFSMDANCGKSWSSPFVTTIIRLNIDEIRKSRFHRTNFTFNIERWEEIDRRELAIFPVFGYAEKFMSFLSVDYVPNTPLCNFTWSTDTNRELKECRYEAYCGRFRITSRGIGAVWAESLVAVECETRHFQMARLALAALYTFFSRRLSGSCLSMCLSFRFFALALWLALHFVINHGHVDAELQESQNFMWNTVSLSALVMAVVALFTGGCTYAIERATYSIMESVTFLLIARVATVDGGWDYNSRSGLAIFSATGIAQLLFFCKLGMFPKYCRDICSRESSVEDLKSAEHYRRRVDAVTQLHLQKMREDLLHNMDSDEFNNYVSKLSPAGLKSLENFLKSGSQITPYQQDLYDRRSTGTCWDNGFLAAVSTALFGAAAWLCFYDTIPL